MLKLYPFEFKQVSVAGLVSIFSFLGMGLCFIFGFHWDQIKTDILDELTGIYRLKPIISLSVNTVCQSDEQYLPFGKWSGTVKGCIYNKNLYRGDCPEDKSDSGSDDMNSLNAYKVYDGQKISEIEPVNFTKYKGNHFCVKYSKSGYEDYLNNIDSDGINCKTGYKKCGILDNLNQPLCELDSQECPINNLLISKESINNSELYSKAILSDNSTFYYSNKFIDKQALLRIKVSEGNICANPEDTDSKQYYILDYFYNTSSCEQVNNKMIDESFKYLDKTTKNELFIENGITNTISSLYKLDYSSYLEGSLNFYYSNYKGYNKKCYFENKSQFNGKNAENIATINSTFQKIVISQIVVLAVNLLVLILMSVVVAKTKKNAKAMNLVQYASDILILGGFILNIFAYTNIAQRRLNFSCGDTLTNSLAELNNSSLTSKKNFEIITLLIYCFIIASLILIYFLAYRENNNGTSDFKENLVKKNNSNELSQ